MNKTLTSTKPGFINAEPRPTSGLGSAFLKPGSEEQLKQVKLQFIRKSENRSLNRNTFKSGHLAKTLGCFGAGKWGGTSGQQNHGAQQQNYEAQPYRMKKSAGLHTFETRLHVVGIGLRNIKTRLRIQGSRTMEPSNKITKPSIAVCRGQLGFAVSELGFALWKLGSTLSGLGSAFSKPGSEEQLKQVKLQFIRKSSWASTKNDQRPGVRHRFSKPSLKTPKPSSKTTKPNPTV